VTGRPRRDVFFSSASSAKLISVIDFIVEVA